jgi:hypothetical protein
MRLPTKQKKSPLSGYRKLTIRRIVFGTFVRIARNTGSKRGSMTTSAAARSRPDE